MKVPLVRRYHYLKRTEEKWPEPVSLEVLDVRARQTEIVCRIRSIWSPTAIRAHSFVPVLQVVIEKCQSTAAVRVRLYYQWLDLRRAHSRFIRLAHLVGLGLSLIHIYEPTR